MVLNTMLPDVLDAWGSRQVCVRVANVKVGHYMLQAVEQLPDVDTVYTC